MTVLSRSRAQSVERHDDEVTVVLTDGRTVIGSHCLLAVGSRPNTAGIDLEEAGIRLDSGGFIEVDRVSRTSARGDDAAGYCTGVLMVASGEVPARVVTLPLRGNARAKMQGSRDGFVKLICRKVTGIVIGGVVVAPRASELIYPVAIAVAQRLTVDQVSESFTVYPSMTGSIAEAARRLKGTGTIS